MEDWTHRPLASYVRESIWQFFCERNQQAPLLLPWYRDLELWVNLGDELSRFLFVEGCYDPNEFVFLDNFLQPGMRFLDVGAHQGVYTAFAARCLAGGGEVWSIEPSSRERSWLVRNLSHNGLANVTVFPVALGEADGFAELVIASESSSGRNSLATIAPFGAGQETVPVRSLASLVAEHGPVRLDAIKIDAEGAETRIIAGCSQVLRDLKPVILFEAQEELLRGQNSSVRELLDTVKSHDYRIYTFDRNTALLTAADENQADDLNLVALPASQVPLGS
jgi:FkbM family methyltransferase